MPSAMTTHPSPTSGHDAVHSMRQRAWQEYLEATRDSDRYVDDEQEAWERLQERLEDIEADLLVAHSDR
jgi:predicted ArsR family transcriptional regulator